ncbi:ATP-binding protein [Microbacterium sp. bgisy189]|uniref:ATP-binding protein n=1 Tax=Microbacterium sp. bgisy189 TaxID=3413798 RepID=UPI003EC0A4D8
MTILIPATVGLTDVELVIPHTATFTGSSAIEFEDGVAIDVHPMVLCAVAAQAARLSRSGERLALVEGASLPSRLREMGLAEHLGVNDHNRQFMPDPTGRFIPVQRVESNVEANRLVTDFVPLLHAEPKTASAVTYVLWELLRNVLEHAGQAGGAYVAADLVDGRVRLGVADAGVGVPQTIRRFHAAPTDREAIALAFQPGISGTTKQFGGNETNGGAGLFFMRSMCAVAGQSLVMASDGSLMRIEEREEIPDNLAEALETATTTWLDLSAPLQGTVVGVNLVLNLSGEYEELFKQIRGIYHARVSARKKQARKARFT